MQRVGIIFSAFALTSWKINQHCSLVSFALYHSDSVEFNPLPNGTTLFPITGISLMSLHSMRLPPIKSGPPAGSSDIDYC